METKHYNANFFFIVLLGISTLAFFVIKPFLLGIFLASVLAIMLGGPYRFLLKATRGRQHLSAFLTSIGGVVFMLLGIILISTLVANELAGLVRGMASSENSYEAVSQNLINIVQANQFTHSVGADMFINKDLFLKISSQLTTWGVALIQAMYVSFANLAMLLFVAFFSLYYFLMEGRNLVSRVMYLSPLKNSHEKLLVDKFVSMTRATVKGALVVGLVQGVIAAMVFMIAGVPSASIWGGLVMLFSLIPLLGSGIVWLPIGIVLLLIGHLWQGMLVITMGFGVISTIDNFIRPKLVGSGVQMHPLLVLFATLGGLSMFGFFGFIIGPIIMALFLTLWDIYAIEFRRQLKKYNA